MQQYEICSRYEASAASNALFSPHNQHDVCSARQAPRLTDQLPDYLLTDSALFDRS